MSKVCQITGKKAITGNNVSHSKRRTKRKFNVNVSNRKFYWVEQGQWIRLTVSAAGLRNINRMGLDAEFINMEFENLLGALIDGKVDCLIGMDYEPLRLKYANASNPMYTEDLGDGMTFVSVMYITKTNTDLQTAINNTIRKMQEDGTISTIIGN